MWTGDSKNDVTGPLQVKNFSIFYSWGYEGKEKLGNCPKNDHYQTQVVPPFYANFDHST